MTNIKVIGIDPAPSKKSTICDGQHFLQKSPEDLKCYLQELQSNANDKILICWDAPLSFGDNKSNFYTRKIESFFNNPSRLPKGISVQGFAGCPHWAISQHLLGYPKIGDFDHGAKPPFGLVFEREAITKSVTEVHPGLAIWVWLKDVRELNENWLYKKNSTTRTNIESALGKLFPKDKQVIDQIENDDHLDAYVAWKLGRVWIDDEGKTVRILGNTRLGSFLLPYNESIFNDFKALTEK